RATEKLITSYNTVQLAHAFEANPDRLFALEQHLVDQGTSQHSEVGPPHDGSEIGIGTGAAHSLPDRHVHGAEPLLLAAVVIRRPVVARFHTGIDESLIEGVLHLVAVVDS